MPVDVTTDIVIQRPASEVAAFAGEPANAPRWYTNIESVEWQSPPPMRIGSLLRFSARFLGRSLTYTYKVVELVREERLVMKTEDGPFPMETTYRWEAIGDRATRMTLRNRGGPSGFSGVAAPLMSMAIGRANQKDLARLKALLEGGD